MMQPQSKAVKVEKSRNDISCRSATVYGAIQNKKHAYMGGSIPSTFDIGENFQPRKLKRKSA